MKLSFVVSMTSAELKIVREAEEKIYEIASSLPNIGKWLTPELIAEKREVYKKGFDIQFKRYNNVHNFLYLINLKDTLEVEVTLNLSKDMIELVSDIHVYYSSLGLPILDSVIGIFTNMNGSEIKGKIKEFDDRFEAMKGKSNTNLKVAHGDVIEVDFNSETDKESEEKSEEEDKQ